jgi:ankyrin repeat protein
MLLFATIFFALSTMATSQPSPPAAGEVYSMMMDHFRSSKMIHVTRNGQTMMNPYHFYKGEDASVNQELAVTLLDEVYAAPIKDQPTLANKLALENDKASTFMVWDAFITGHIEVLKALRTFVVGPIGSPLWEASMSRSTGSRIEMVLQASAETKTEAIEKFLADNDHEGPQLFFEAAVHGDEAVLAHMIDAGHEIHPKSDPSNMLLHAACYNGHLGAVQQLINAGVDVNHLDEHGSTPLMRAAVGGKLELVEWLLQNDADVRIRETRTGGSTALELGVGSAGVARLLIDHGAEWSATAFASAVHRGDEGAIRLLSETGDFVQFDSMPTEFEQKTPTDRQREAVLLAIRYCASRQAASREVLRWLLRHVALSYDGDVFELDASDKELIDAVRASISGAIRSDDAETARLLIKSLPASSIQGGPEEATSSNTNSVNDWLFDAIRRNSTSVTRMLFEELDMDPNIVLGPQSETPLAIAALAGHTDMIKLLVSTFKASIHKASGTYANGPTPLWHAIRSQNEAAARALLELGGPFENIHAAIKGGEKRLWLTARKQELYRSPVLLVAWMVPEWYDEDSDDMFLCLEFPDGFQGEVLNRKQDQELLDAGDERHLAADTDNHGIDQPKGWLTMFSGWFKLLRG